VWGPAPRCSSSPLAPGSTFGGGVTRGTPAPQCYGPRPSSIKTTGFVMARARIIAPPRPSGANGMKPLIQHTYPPFLRWAVISRFAPSVQGVCLLDTCIGHEPLLRGGGVRHWHAPSDRLKEDPLAAPESKPTPGAKASPAPRKLLPQPRTLTVRWLKSCSCSNQNNIVRFLFYFRFCKLFAADSSK